MNKNEFLILLQRFNTIAVFGFFIQFAPIFDITFFFVLARKRSTTAAENHQLIWQGKNFAVRHSRLFILSRSETSRARHFTLGGSGITGFVSWHDSETNSRANDFRGGSFSSLGPFLYAETPTLKWKISFHGVGRCTTLLPGHNNQV